MPVYVAGGILDSVSGNVLNAGSTLGLACTAEKEINSITTVVSIKIAN